ncbi:MAG: M60 family metallopeptidase [Bacteroidaceae bacterium]|nr:M60 family metallopeptidase [Bacteroidaceae bacterium]
MKKLKQLAVVLLLTLCSTAAYAQLASLTDGAVYHFQNVGNTGIALSASALSDVAGSPSNTSNKSQQWYVKKNGNYYTFRNLGNGRYLQGAGASASWGLTSDASANANLFELASVGSNNTIRSKADSGNGYGYMHRDAGNNIVGWETGNNSTQWTLTKVDYTTAELNAIWDEIASLIPDEATVSGYQAALDAIFSDKACTKLKGTYTSMTVANMKNDANYKKLPAELQAMVLKVRNGDWSEANAASGKSSWSDDYARKFRVQMYEPYSVEGEITSYLRFNAHSNMDNPTGLFANSGQQMFIMVEGDIADGAELWVAHVTGHGLTSYYNNSAYTQLKEGLNIIPYFSDGSQLWINYVVHTYNSNGATLDEQFPHKISDFNPLKIHIEGGHINGYYNAIGDFRAADSGTEDLWGEVDNDDDWDYYKVRAPLNGTDGVNSDFALLGHRQTLLFELGNITDDDDVLQKGLLYHLDDITVPSKPHNNSGLFSDYTNMGLNASNGKINIMLEAWDRIMYSELATMGLVSTSTMDKMNLMYPRWTAEGAKAEIYNYGKSAADQKTYAEFCQGLDYSEYFNHHGAAVGSYSGYMSGGWRCCNYHYNTMSSIIGRIAYEPGPTWGPAHEIGHQHQGTFNLNGQTEVTNNFFSNVAVWYMGMGTSRYNGSEGCLQSVLDAFNTEGNDAYTNNIWALTHIYYRLWLYYHLAGNNTQFWPRLYELCRRVPILNGGQISGETSLLRFYQHACEAAGEDLTEFFRAHGYLEVMDNRLVGDYSNAYYNQTQEQIDAAIAAVKAKNYPENLAVLFINDGTSNTGVQHDGVTARSLWDSNPTAEYGSVTDFIEGNVSVEEAYTAVVDADGNVTMSGGEGGVGFIVLNEDGEIVSFSNKSSFSLSEEAAYLVATGAATISTLDAESNTTAAELDLSAMQSALLSELIGKAEVIANLTDDTGTKIGFYRTSELANLKSALATAKEQLTAGTGLAAAYEMLYSEYEAVLDNYIPFSPAHTYILTNYAYPTRKLVVSGGVIYANEKVNDTDNAARWIFKETGAAGVYNVVNANGQYAPKIAQSTQMNVTAEANAEAKYVVESLGNGLWAVSLTPQATGTSFHAAAGASYKVVGWETGADATKWYLTAVKLDEEVVAKDKLAALVAKTQELIDKMATVEDVKTALGLQVDKVNDPYYLSCSNVHIGEGSMAELIDNNNSTYMHTNWSNVSATNDWLDVDLGSGNELSMFAFSEVTRSGVVNDFPKTIEIYGTNTKSNNTSDYTHIATVTGLPQSGGKAWESDAIVANNNYRYLRFVVTTGTNRIYFHMAEFDLYSVQHNITMSDGFTSVNTELVKSAYINMLKGANVATADDVATATTNLQASYDALLAAYDEARASQLEGEKAALQALIDQTNELIDNVGSVEYVPGGAVDLHGKIYCNAPYTAGGTSHSDYSSAANDYNLLDGDVYTHFHSDYNTATMVADPYVRIDLGEGNAVRKFNFNYTTRTQSGCAPTAISVYGGNYDANANVLGDVTTADYLGSVTTPTRIAIQNLSSTANDYFAGITNVNTFSENVIFVWEPVNEGVAGSYYLRLENKGDNGYLQAGNAAIALGTKDNAQVFAVTEPSTSGSGSTYFNGDKDVQITTNLVRFVQGSTAGTSWINCQKGANAPVYNSGTGGYTIHNVYLIVGGGGIVYSETPVAEFTSGDAENPLTTATATKWTSKDITADKAYRYYKFVVTASQGNNTGGHFFVMSEFGFDRVAVEEATVDAEFAEYVNEEMLLDAAYSINNAEAAMEFATTAEQLQVQQNELQTAYDVLQEAYNKAFNLDGFKAQLQELVQRTDELLNASAICEYEYSRGDYLTTNSYNITSNAGQNSEDGNTGGNNDGAGIAGLLDEDPATYFHSRWGGAVVNEAHYLQIDLGEENKLSNFFFEYATRKAGSAGNTSPAPTEIEVRAGNDPATLGSAAAIVTLTKDGNGLPAYSDLGASWTSDCISAAENSRYIRLTVTNSEGPGGNSYGGQYFFAMGTLKVAKAVKGDIKSATARDKYSVASNEVAAALAELQAAVALLKTDASASALATQLSDLQAAYDALDAKIKFADSYPVYLTGDANNPVVYNIYINRAATTLLEYDATSKKVAVEDFVAGREAQGWYFMPAADGKVKIYPYTGEGNLLATNNYTEGADRVEAVAEGADGYGYEWEITRITDSEWYNITILNNETTYYLSNYGGVSNKMGFYNTNPSTDLGSMFKFELADYSKSEAYYTLLNYFNSLDGLATVNDDVVGCYNSVTGVTYNEMYFIAKDLLEEAVASDAEFTEAYNNLKAAAEALELTMPKEDTYYSIKSAHTGYAAASYIYNEKTDRRIAWSTTVNTQNAQAVWQFVEDGESLYLTNLHTGASIAEYNYNSMVYTQDEGAAISIISIDTRDAQVGLRIGTNASKLMHAQNWQGNIVTWETKTAGSASAWYIETVDKADISYTVSVGAAEWATLCLNYPVTVPAGVTAYAVVGIEGSAVLLQSVGDVIAAGVPVLLNGVQGSYEFKHADTEGTVPETNLLMGSCYDIFVEAESDMQYYILALNAQGNVAMCIVYHEYNADGSLAGENTDNGTHFKNNANKVYLPIEQTGNASRAYSLRILDGTTGIDAVVGEGAEVEGIYDLSGRRIKEMTAPGVYIVNGKKIIKK